MNKEQAAEILINGDDKNSMELESNLIIAITDYLIMMVY
jgi:hypothetical protein